MEPKVCNENPRRPQEKNKKDQGKKSTNVCKINRVEKKGTGSLTVSNEHSFEYH